MEFDNNLFCKNVTRLRKLKGYSKYQMSIQSDIYYQQYCEIENGNIVPNFKAVISIANALNTDISSLIEITTSPQKEMLKINILSMLKNIINTPMLNKIYDITTMIKTWTEIKDD